MTILIITIASDILIALIIIVAKWQICNDIKKIKKEFNEANKKTKATGKEDITEGILLRAGFHKITSFSIICSEYYSIELSDVYIDIYNSSNIPTRSWNIRVINYKPMFIANTYIQTIEHFNKLMDLIDISFRLKEE